MDDAERLYVSDDPETFKAHAQLFQAALPADGTVARILFDHVNGTAIVGPGVPMRLIAAIVNTNDTAGTIDVLGAKAGPNANGMAAGHTATKQFLQAHEIDQNVESHAVAAGGNVPLGDFVLQAGAAGKTGDCATGIFDVQCHAGNARYEVRVMACDPSSGLDKFGSVPKVDSDGKFRRGVFDISGTATVQTIEFGGAPVTIGPQHQFYPHVSGDTYPGPGHTGEYGVLKRFRCDMTGPQQARLAQSARGAGNATATYLIDDELVESHQFSPNPFLRVKSFDVPDVGAPVNVVTMAEINSTLPIQCAIGPDAPPIADAPIVQV